MTTECTVDCRGCTLCLAEMLQEMHPDASTLTLMLGGEYVDVCRWGDLYSIYVHPSEYTERTLDAAVSILLSYALNLF